MRVGDSNIPRALFNISVESESWEKYRSYLESDIDRVGRHVLEHLGVPSSDVEVSLLLTDDSDMRRLNAEYRGIDKPTNVLSFEGDIPDSTSQTLPCILGSIAISYETLDRESESQGKTFLNHLTHLIVHAMLHLLGYDHEKSEQNRGEMERIEKEILNHFDISDPYE